MNTNINLSNNINFINNLHQIIGEIEETTQILDTTCNIFLNRILGRHFSYLNEYDDNEDDDSYFNHFGLNVLSTNFLFPVSNGVDKEILNNLPKIKIGDENKLEHDRCVICLDDFKKDDEVIKTPCLHVFHSKCIIEWFNNKNTCPICKFEIK